MMNDSQFPLHEGTKANAPKFGCLRTTITTLVLLATMFWALAHLMPSCDEGSDAVAYARSLSQERLKKLYYDMERLASDESNSDLCYERKPGENMPDPFSDLQVIKIRPHDGNIMVQGCFDHHVYLRFEGFTRLRSVQNERQIVLSWGEWEPEAGEQVLWREQPEQRR